MVLGISGMTLSLMPRFSEGNKRQSFSLWISNYPYKLFVPYKWLFWWTQSLSPGVWVLIGQVDSCTHHWGKNRPCHFQFSSVQFSRSAVFNSLQPHESQHARPPCPSPTARVHSDSCPSSQWCHPAISSSVVPFSSCPQSLLASESFPMSQLFIWGGQGTGVSALASFLPKKSQGWGRY